ncbi:cell envelope integrity protein TolA [Streptomyces sp. NPDC127051]|uniref:cell envelope integrity protein TolA n=1 Tax=Streptomyces sp. NPDC127051 TaxID=3347119 RepID=UPI0036627C42
MTAEFTYPEPLGSAVRARLDDGRTFLLHLDRNRPVAWDDDVWELVLGPGVPVVANILARRGYVHRIRFEDRPGGGRVMKFGTELPGRGTTWESLDEVTLTSEGLTTTDRPDGVRIPLAEASRGGGSSERSIVAVTRSHSRTVMAARQDDPVKRAVMHLDRALREQNNQIYGAVGTIRRLLEASQTPENVARLRLALGRGQVWTEQRARHRRAVIEQLKERPTSSALLLKAAALVRDPDATLEERKAVHAVRVQQKEDEAARHRALVEQRAARLQRAEAERQREFELRRQAERAAVEERRETEEAHRQAQAEKRRLAEEADRQAHAEKLAYLALFVSGALKKAAREGRTTTWEEIGQRTGQLQLGRLTHQDKLEVLETVEKKTLPESPLWSAVLAAASTDEALRLHREVSHLLQRDVPDNDSDLVIELTADCAQLRRQ